MSPAGKRRPCDGLPAACVVAVACIAGQALACAHPDRGGGVSSDAAPSSSASPASTQASVASTQASVAAAWTAALPASAPEPDLRLCAAICARSDGLHCREAASCVRRCEAMRAMPLCKSEVRAALDCFASTTATGWTCNDHGLPSVRVGLCDAEQSRATRCLAANPPTASR